MTTDITTEGPVIWQAENPTMRKTAMAQNPANPVLNNLVTSGQVVCLTCLKFTKKKSYNPRPIQNGSEAN